jgi:hypothetical protein
MSEKVQRGWFWTYPEPKRHYFVDKKSLCGKVSLPIPDPSVAKMVIASEKNKKKDTEEKYEKVSNLVLKETARDTSNNCTQCQKLANKQFD